MVKTANDEGAVLSFHHCLNERIDPLFIKTEKRCQARKNHARFDVLTHRAGFSWFFETIEMPGKKIKKITGHFKIFLFDAIISNKRKYYEIPGIKGTL
jgi:hypothetical protein